MYFSKDVLRLKKSDYDGQILVSDLDAALDVALDVAMGKDIFNMAVEMLGLKIVHRNKHNSYRKL